MSRTPLTKQTVEHGLAPGDVALLCSDGLHSMLHDDQIRQALIPFPPSLEEALKAAADTDARESFVIGGGEIFKLALPMAQKIVLTRVHTVIEGDAFFPEISTHEWALKRSEPHDADEKNNLAYTFEVWERK